MTDLIQQLEQASAGSRELDWEIFGAIQWLGNPEAEALNYTTSLTAALTLVPEGWNTGNLNWYKDGTCSAIVSRDDFEKSGMGFAKTPALALVIAALKAIEAEKE